MATAAVVDVVVAPDGILPDQSLAFAADTEDVVFDSFLSSESPVQVLPPNDPNH